MTLSSTLSGLNKSSVSRRDRRRSSTATPTKDDCDTVSLTEDEFNKSIDEPFVDRSSSRSDNDETTIDYNRRMIQKQQQYQQQQANSFRSRRYPHDMEESGDYDSPFYPSSQDEHDDHRKSRSSRRLRPSIKNDRHESLSDEELMKRRSERGLRNKKNVTTRRERLVSFRQQSQSTSNAIHDIEEEEDDDPDMSLSHDDEPRHKKHTPLPPTSRHRQPATSQPQRNDDYYNGNNSSGSSISHDDEPRHKKPPAPSSHHRQLSPSQAQHNNTHYDGSNSPHHSSCSSHDDEHDSQPPPTHRPQFPQQQHRPSSSRRLSAPHTTSYHPPNPPSSSPRTRRSSMSATISPHPARRSSFNPASTTPYTASIPRVPSTDSMASSQSRNSIPYFDDFEIPEGAVMSQEKFGNAPTRNSSGSINYEMEDLLCYEDDYDVEDIPLGSNHGRTKKETAAAAAAVEMTKKKKPQPRRFSMPVVFQPAVHDVSLHSDEDDDDDRCRKQPSPRVNKKKIQRRHSMAVDSIIQDDFEDYHQQDLHAEIERKRLRKQQRAEAAELRRQRELEMDIRNKLQMRQQQQQQQQQQSSSFRPLEQQQPQHYNAPQGNGSHLWESDDCGYDQQQQQQPLHQQQQQQQQAYRSQRRYSMPVSNLTPVDENHTWESQPPPPPQQQHPSQRRMSMPLSALPPVNERHAWDPSPPQQQQQQAPPVAASQWTLKKPPPPTEKKSLRQSIVESQKEFRESVLYDANRRLSLEDIEKDEELRELARNHDVVPCETFDVNPSVRSSSSSSVPLVPAFEVNASRHIYNCRKISYVKVSGEEEEEEYGRRGTTISVDVSVCAS